MRAASFWTCQNAAPSTAAPGAGGATAAARLPLIVIDFTVHAAQVEVEPVESLDGDEVDRGDPGELTVERRGRGCRGRVFHREVVMQDVVAAVAGEGKYHIIRAGGSRY